MNSHAQRTVSRSTLRSLGVIFGCLLLLQWTNSSAHSRPLPAAAGPGDSTGYDTITLAIVGDLMCHASQFEKARTKTGFDFRPVFEPVKKYLREADLSFGNLETVTAGEEAKFTGYPQFNTPDEYLDALKDAGFDVITSANNHSLDRRFPGVVRTLDELDKRALLHTGTARSATERNTPLILQKGSIRMGVLAYTFSTNGIPIPAGQEFSVNRIDTAQIRKDVEANRAAGADVLVAFMHWGVEYARNVSKQQADLADFLHDLGVMLIMGSHPHVLQGVQVRAWGDYDPSFTAYSLGNFLSGQRKQYTDGAMILRFKLIKDKANKSYRYASMDYIPTYVSVSNGYRILPVAEALKAIRNGDRTHPAYTADKAEQVRLQQVWKETTEHINSHGTGLFPAEEN